MSDPINSQTYSLKYLPEEDRLLLSMEINPEQEWAVLVTRSLIKKLLGALASILENRPSQATGQSGHLRHSILQFEHSTAVDVSAARGETRKEERPARTLLAPPRLAREIKLTPKEDGSVVMIFDDGDRNLTVDLTAARVHVFIGIVLELAGGAGWDFPTIASWLAGAAPDAAPAHVQLH